MYINMIKFVAKHKKEREIYEDFIYLFIILLETENEGKREEIEKKHMIP